jgi:hypothetical protein
MAMEPEMADEAGRLDADAPRRSLASAWLALGVTALALAGLYAVLLVVARAPGAEPLFPTQDFFRVALIVHVDQSVLIWFLAFSGVLWALRRTIPGLSWGAFIVAAVGCLMVAAAPFLSVGEPLLNNYVPILDHPFFLTGLGVFAAGLLLQVLAYVPWGGRHQVGFGDPLGVGTATAAFAVLLAGVSLIWTWLGMSTEWTGPAFYEHLFWGPGHVLQFAYTQVMLVAWIWIARAVRRPLGVPDRWLSVLLLLGVLPLFLVPVIHGFHAPDSAESRLYFTRLMQYGNGLAAVPIGLLLTISLIRARREPVSEGGLPAYRALVASLILFAAGGVIGVSIAGVNTVIPAHYHGSIVGVTLALMGLTYHLLPQLGFARAEGRMARWQAVVYGSGQLVHIAGLAASGAMGIQRKTAGAAQGLDGMAKAFMGLMGLGGLLAVVGGVLFVLVVLIAFAGRGPDRVPRT